MKLSTRFRNELRELCEAAQTRTDSDHPDFIFADFVLGYLASTEPITPNQNEQRARARLFPSGVGRTRA